MEQSEEIDFLVIGGGSAGYAAARTAAELGLKTMVIEGGPAIGGLCILRGCMPSKAIIESANRFLTLRKAKEFGLRAENISVVPSEIIARKRRLIAEFAGYREEQLKSGTFDFVRGMAAFESPNRVSVTSPDGSSSTLSFKTAIITTGSSINHPDIPGLKEAGYLTSDDVLDSEHLPASVVVLGGGPVALEMAHYYNGLGSQVTVIQRSSQILKGVDADVAEALAGAMRKNGITLFTDTKLIRVAATKTGRLVVFEHEGREMRVEAEVILQSLGRKPATTGLNLANAGITPTGDGVPVNLQMETPMEGIYAAGDVSGPHEIVHIAIAQGELAARNAARRLGILQGEPEEMDYRLSLFAVFSEPQLAVAGLSEAGARASGRDIVSAKYPFDDHGKSLVMGETEGFVKMIADRKTGEILGASVVGPHASDLIHEVVVGMAFRSTAEQFAKIPHYHPTLSEIWGYPAEEIAQEIKP